MEPKHCILCCYILASTNTPCTFHETTIISPDDTIIAAGFDVTFGIELSLKELQVSEECNRSSGCTISSFLLSCKI